MSWWRKRLGATAARRITDEIYSAPLPVADLNFVADPSGALYLESEGALLVADLHLEKGSSFARRGMLLPPYDTAVTLAMLAAVIERYEPRVVLALGDSFHDPSGADRLRPEDRARIASLQHGRDWLWLTGNHDPHPQNGLDGEFHAIWQLGTVTLRHEPAVGLSTPEIAGHLHPAARIVGTGGATRRRCFVSNGMRCVMPAFGAYAGGLNILHPAFAPLFGRSQRVAHALGRDRVYAVPLARCSVDG